jgi:aerobic carbon-monoxide dehydrogenase large subunit
MSAHIGESVRRREDLRLLTGHGSYADDVSLPGQAYAVFVRSPHAHARILSVDAAAARAVDGVLAVLTAADAVADGLQPIPHSPHAVPPDVVLTNTDGSAKRVTPHFPYAVDRARFVGEVVAMVVGETIDAAKNGAELVAVDYEELPSVTRTPDAIAPGAPLLREEVPANICIDAEVGDKAATDAAFAAAAHVVTLKTWIPRITGVHMEPRTAIGVYDPAEGAYTLHAAGGSGQVRIQGELATVLGVPPATVRVIAKDVGGSFGTRNNFYPEFALIAWASRRTGRPVKHLVERQEAFQSDYQARDLFVEAALALDAAGNFLALRSSNVSNVGAHSLSFVPLTKGAQVITSVYRIPVAHVRARAVMSNTQSTIPYRSAGRPEAIFVIERLVDLAAQAHGFDRVALRARNMIPREAMPYTNAFGIIYDSGDYASTMKTALELGDWQGFAARRDEARRRGKLRGIAIANYVETTGGNPRERAEITVRPDGIVDLIIGTQTSGQGHETSFPQLVAEWLGVSMDCVNFISGDTKFVKAGGGSHSGRSMRYASIVINKATTEIIRKGTEIAAHVLEAATVDIAFAEGRFTVKGTDRSLSIFEVAAEAVTVGTLPEGLRGALGAVHDEVIGIPSYPFGSHVCEIEIDPDTGGLAVVRYAAVDDVGRAVNPLILHGQTHGGIAQGLGQALLEQSYSDPKSGQLLAGSFMDYAMPRSTDLPSFVTSLSEVPAANHPHGMRSGGEGGTTPALGAAINAIVDALAELGVTHVEMPATPERVWRAIQTAAGRG